MIWMLPMCGYSSKPVCMYVTCYTWAYLCLFDCVFLVTLSIWFCRLFPARGYQSRGYSTGGNSKYNRPMRQFPEENVSTPQPLIYYIVVCCFCGLPDLSVLPFCSLTMIYYNFCSIVKCEIIIMAYWWSFTVFWTSALYFGLTGSVGAFCVCNILM